MTAERPPVKLSELGKARGARLRPVEQLKERTTAEMRKSKRDGERLLPSSNLLLGGSDETIEAIRQLFHAEDENRQDVFDTLKSDDDVLALEPPQYVIDGWLPVGFFSDFFGAPGSKKTFVILDMLRCIAAGKKWHGHDVRQGATILFEGEGLEQLQGRIIAWNEGYEVTAPIPARWTDAPVNLTTPEGVAAVARTVRKLEMQLGESVVAVGFDPIVEYMVGNEVDGGNELVTRGLRALAQYLHIAVPTGVHTNAAGERARGSDHLRMRSGAHVKVETLSDGSVGLVQEKLKNGPESAIILLPQSVGPSLVLDKLEEMPKDDYFARQAEGERKAKRAAREAARSTAGAARSTAARDLIFNAVQADPGISQRVLLERTVGHDVGSKALLDARDALAAEGVVRIAGGARKAALHYPVENTERGES